MKVYLTRDENDDFIYVWFGSKKPVKMKGCDIVSFTRYDNMANNDCDVYTLEDFKKKFGFTINKKTIKRLDILDSALKSEDYKMFSDDKNRKK